MGDIRNAYKLLIGNPEGKILLGRPKRRSESNVKIDLKQDIKAVNWLKLAQVKGQ
jgi:hypothetical protein